MNSIKKTIIILIISILITTIYLCVYGFDVKINYADGFFASGAIIFFVGLLSLVSSYGAFNTFSYAGKSITRKKDEHSQSYGNYVESKSKVGITKRLNFIPYVSIGIIFIIISLIINIL